MKEAKFYQKLDKLEVKCDLCHHGCVIKNKQAGICGVRKNDSGVLYTLNYGHPVAMEIDPIEKKPLFHFYPGSQALSIGTLGCNLSCSNCQNWNISQSKQIAQKIQDLDYVTPEKIVEDAIGNGCNSIAYTYNEPTIFAEYALDIMKLAQANDIKNVWVSNGYMSETCLEAIIPYLDAINVDIKSFEDSFYVNHCQANLSPILKNLERLKREQVHLEITTLLVPTLSDDIDMISKLAEFIVTTLDTDTPWHVSKFSPSISWKLKSLPETGDDLIYESYEIGKDAGVKYMYIGNIPGDQRENTYCPKCSELSIRRLGYHIERLDSSGRCLYCDRNLDIIE